MTQTLSAVLISQSSNVNMSPKSTSMASYGTILYLFVNEKTPNCFDSSSLVPGTCRTAIRRLCRGGWNIPGRRPQIGRVSLGRWGPVQGMPKGIQRWVCRFFRFFLRVLPTRICPKSFLLWVFNGFSKRSFPKRTF